MKRTLSQVLALGSIKLDPCSRDEDGSIERASKLTMEMESADGRADMLGHFAGSSGDDLLACQIAPGAGHDGQPPVSPWSGVVRIAGFRLAPPTGEQVHPRGTLRIVLHATCPVAEPGLEDVEPLLALFTMRTTMASAGAVNAQVDLKPYQGKIEFEEDEEE